MKMLICFGSPRSTDVDVEDRHEDADLLRKSALDHLCGRGTDLDDLAVGGRACGVGTEGAVSLWISEEEERENAQRHQKNANHGPADDPNDRAGEQRYHSEGPPLRGYHQSVSVGL